MELDWINLLNMSNLREDVPRIALCSLTSRDVEEVHVRCGRLSRSFSEVSELNCFD